MTAHVPSMEAYMALVAIGKSKVKLSSRVTLINLPRIKLLQIGTSRTRNVRHSGVSQLSPLVTSWERMQHIPTKDTCTTSGQEDDSSRARYDVLHLEKCTRSNVIPRSPRLRMS